LCEQALGSVVDRRSPGLGCSPASYGPRSGTRRGEGVSASHECKRLENACHGSSDGVLDGVLASVTGFSTGRRDRRSSCVQTCKRLLPEPHWRTSRQHEFMLDNGSSNVLKCVRNHKPSFRTSLYLNDSAQAFQKLDREAIPTSQKRRVCRLSGQSKTTPGAGPTGFARRVRTQEEINSATDPGRVTFFPGSYSNKI
jgi:hypothetical protein